MTAFALTTALLTAAVIFLVTRPLLRLPRQAWAGADEVNAAVYREQLAELDAQLAAGALSAEHHARAREAIRLRLASDLSAAPEAGRSPAPARGLALAAAIGIAAAGVGLYALLGTPAALEPQARPAAAADPNAHGLQSAQIAAMAERLAIRLQANPDDLNGWVMLARSYSALGRFDDGARAYGEAARIAPRDAPLLADYADVLAMARGRSFDGEPDRLIARALAADGSNVKALALAGSSAFARKDHARAVELWSRILALVPADSNMGRSIEASIAQARALAGKAAAGAPAASVSGTVTLAPGLAERVKEGATLFVYARAVGGSRQPAAIARLPAAGWPVRFTLDDSSAMDRANRLSSHREVALEARVSPGGSATAASGDLRATVSAVKVGASGIAIEIASVVP